MRTSQHSSSTFYASILAIFALLLSACTENTGTGSEPGPYSYQSGDKDGIGKQYMGREISRVMGFEGADWLERPDRETQERTDLLIQNLPINPGDTVADIGAGTGYFSFPMAQRVGTDGVVYAVDLQPEMLDIITERAATQAVSNIQPVLASEQDPNLPAETIDFALLVDAYHELEWPHEVMAAVYKSMVSGGKILLVEYRAEDPQLRIHRLHKMTEQQVRKEMAAAGWIFVENRDFLPRQHFLLFEKP